MPSRSRNRNRGTDVAQSESSLTAAQRLAELDQQRASILDSAKQEALTAAKAAVASLNELGFRYTLTAQTQRRLGSSSSRVAKHRSPSGECPICNFATEPPHDGRAHRSQKEKRPFDDAELSALDLARATEELA